MKSRVHGFDYITAIFWTNKKSQGRASSSRTIRGGCTLRVGTVSLRDFNLIMCRHRHIEIYPCAFICVCVCVCVCARARVCVCVYVYVDTVCI